MTKHKLAVYGDVVVLHLRGKLMGGPESTEVTDEIKANIAGGFKKFVIDLGDVEWMNSMGLGMLIGSLTSITNAGGSLYLARVAGKIESVLAMTRLSGIFNTSPTVEEALTKV